MPKKKLIIKLPTLIKASRGSVDLEMERVRHCVIPIISESESNRPFVAGSAVIVKYENKVFMLTAKHVLDIREGKPLGYFAHDHEVRNLRESFIYAEGIDLAGRILNEADLADLAHIIPMELASGSVTGDPADQFYGSVAGYPATQAKSMAKDTIDTRMTMWSNTGFKELDGSVSVSFDKKQGALLAGTHVRPKDPYGMSGGAIFGMKLVGLNGIETCEARLVGIATDWDKESRKIRGPGLGDIHAILIGCIQGAAQETKA